MRIAFIPTLAISEQFHSISFMQYLVLGPGSNGPDNGDTIIIYYFTSTYAPSVFSSESKSLDLAARLRYPTTAMLG